jgi:uncharacterized RDD family membrane protein YckC
VIEETPPSERTHVDLPVPRSGARLLSSAVDALVCYIVLTAIFLALITWVIHPVTGTKITAAQSRTESLLYLISVTVTALAFILVQMLTGRSLGKRLLKLKLVDLQGDPPKPWQLVAKYGVIFAVLLVIPRYGPIIGLFGLVYASMQPQRRNAFDLLAKTAVIPADAVAAPD